MPRPLLTSSRHSSQCFKGDTYGVQTDSLRKFYASLRTQRPDSLMARKWCATAALCCSLQPTKICILPKLLDAMRCFHRC